MVKRAGDIEQTRLRITEAAMRLHTTIGPAETTISAVAEEAGVTRLTVYRHFATDNDLFVACSGHWFSLHPPPDPHTWRAVAGVEDRAETALRELYGWFEENNADLYPIRRDFDSLPSPIQAAILRAEVRNAEALVSGSGLRGRERARLRAAAGLVVRYATWRTLVVDEGLRGSDAVSLAVRFLTSAR